MLAVIFEVEPAPGERDAYLAIAAALRPALEGIDGFLSIERFESLSEPGKLLSLSYWRDEAAVQRWRTLEAHREVQAVGRRRDSLTRRRTWRAIGTHLSRSRSRPRAFIWPW